MDRDQRETAFAVHYLKLKEANLKSRDAFEIVKNAGYTKTQRTMDRHIASVISTGHALSQVKKDGRHTSLNDEQMLEVNTWVLGQNSKNSPVGYADVQKLIDDKFNIKVCIRTAGKILQRLGHSQKTCQSKTPEFTKTVNKRPNPSKDTEHHEGGGGEITIAPSAIAVIDPLPEIAVSSSSSNPTENPFVPSSKRRKHNAITVSQKQGVLQLIDEGKTYEEISRIYGIAQSTISNIKENQKQINDLSLQNITSMNNFSNNSNSNSNNNNNTNNNNSTLQGGASSSLSLNYHNYHSKLLKPRLSKCSQIIDERLCEWIVHAQEKNIAISGPKIVEKGKIIASKLNIEFKGSNGWLDSFKKRHNISFRDFRRPTVVASNVTIEDAEEENGAGGVNGEGEENLKDWERKILLAEVEEGEPTTTLTSWLNGNGSDSSDPPSEDEGYEGKDKSLKKLVAEVIDIAANQNHEKISKSTPSKAFRPSNRAITQINVANTKSFNKPVKD